MRIVMKNEFQVNTVQNKTINNTVTGALYDFMGYVTTRKTAVTFGSAFDANPAVRLLEEFCNLRGLDLTEPDIKGWEAFTKEIDKLATIYDAKKNSRIILPTL